MTKLTIQESFQIWLGLQVAFEKQLQETEAMYGAERKETLAELQIRLKRLADWQLIHGKSISINTEITRTAE